MRTQNSEHKALAEKYKAGLCTPEEVKQIQEWYDSFETEGYPFPEEQEIKRAAEEATMQAIRWVSVNQKQARIRKLWMPVLRIAAVLVLVVSAGILIFRGYYQPEAIAWQQVSTATGAKKQVTLPDGSVIWLNSASSITYPKHFGKTSREINLKGEAFFTVIHDAEHPFIVHTRHLNVQVLGTSYNIYAYPDDNNTIVAVATGKVGVSGTRKNNKVFMLTPGQQLAYNELDKRFEKGTLAIGDIGSWQQNAISFNMETLENISKSLGRTYGVTFVFKDKTLMKKRFQIKVKKESLPNIMKLISISGGNFRYTIKGKQVTIG